MLFQKVCNNVRVIVKVKTNMKTNETSVTLDVWNFKNGGSTFLLKGYTRWILAKVSPKWWVLCCRFVLEVQVHARAIICISL